MSLAPMARNIGANQWRVTMGSALEAFLCHSGPAVISQCGQVVSQSADRQRSRVGQRGPGRASEQMAGLLARRRERRDGRVSGGMRRLAHAEGERSVEEDCGQGHPSLGLGEGHLD